MTSLQRALELLGSDQIYSEQTPLIDAALSVANVDEVPAALAANAIDYIDAQLLHNSVDQEVRIGLERLQRHLRARESNRHL